MSLGIVAQNTLYVAVSSHGYGHIAQTAPIVNELHRRIPHLRIVIECAASRDVLARRFATPFEHVAIASDFGMVMKDALEVDVAASHARYVELHSQIDAHVADAQRRLVEHGADLLLSNIPYVPLIAAQRADLPAAAMCSLNWAAIYGGLCAGMPCADRIHNDMLRAYRAADVFIAPEPSMDMPGLQNLHDVGPIAKTGHSVRETLKVRLGIPLHGRLVTVSMGGIATQLPLDRWPRIRDVTWVMPDGVDVGREDMVSHSAIGKPFVDVVRCSDAFITKPGYGAFSEAACNGVPVLYVPRADWPEAPFLVRWLKRRGACSEIAYGDLCSEHLAEALDSLWRMPRPEPVFPAGVNEAADVIERMLTAALRRPAARAGI